MNFSKLFLLMALNMSLNNGAYGMQDDNKKTYSDEKNKQLLLAFEKKNLDLAYIKLLFQSNDNGDCTDVNVQDKYGWTPLYKSASFSNNECMQLLLDNGADVTVQGDDGWTPIHMAACNGNKA